MAKKRKGSQRRRLDVQDLVELVGALADIKQNGGRNGGSHSVVLTDPSVNVKERVDLQAAFDKERRESDKDWQKRLDEQTRRADEAQSKAEAGRIDAKFADVVQSALLAQQATTQAAQTLATTLATATETLRKSQETTDFATRASIRSVEQNQARVLGEGVQRIENTATTRYSSERVIQWLLVFVGMVAAAGTIVYTVHAVTTH